MEVEALAYKLTALMRLGERTALLEVVEQTLAQAQRLEDADIRCYAMAAAALYHLEAGDLVRAAQILLQSLDAARRAKGRQLDLESQYHGHLGFAYAQLGLYRGPRYAGGRPGAGEFDGIGRNKAYQMINLGFVCWRLGDRDTAIQMEEAALKEYAANGDAFGLAACRAYLGYMHEEAGNLASAAQFLAETREGLPSPMSSQTHRSAGHRGTGMPCPGTARRRRGNRGAGLAVPVRAGN